MSIGTQAPGLGVLSEGLGTVVTGLGSQTLGLGQIGGSSGPPTTPLARQTWNAGWRLQAYSSPGFLPAGQRRVFRGRYQNQMGYTAQALALDFVQATASPATFDVSVGPWSTSGNNASAWTNSTVVVPAAPNGTIQPGYARKLISLPSPVAPGDRLIVSHRPPGSDITIVQGLNTNAWPAFQFVEAAEVSFSDVAVDASWPGGIDNIFGGLVGITFLELASDPCIQIAHIGDSLGEMERPIGTTNDLSREGWAVRGNFNEVANGSRFQWNSIANGAFTMTNYLDRLSHLLTTDWVNGVDVVSIQVWTHNERPADVAAAQAQWINIEAAASAVRAAGRGVIFTLLSPPSLAGQTVDQIAAWQWIKTRIASEAHVYLDDLVADGSGTAIDVAYSSSSAPEPIHINEAGQILQASALPARTATALAVLGYSV